MKITVNQPVNIVIDDTVPEGEAWLCLEGVNGTPDKRLATLQGMEELLGALEESDAGDPEGKD